MRGKWERGIEPRNFAWIIKDRLAVSERPGGYARNHRKVRRQEEIIWLRDPAERVLIHHEEFGDRLLGVLAGYLLYAFPDQFSTGPNAVVAIEKITGRQLGAGEKLLLHQEELGDRLMGVIAGYLLATKAIDTGPHAVTVVEQILHRQMGPIGRELVAVAVDL